MYLSRGRAPEGGLHLRATRRSSLLPVEAFFPCPSSGRRTVASRAGSALRHELRLRLREQRQRRTDGVRASIKRMRLGRLLKKKGVDGRTGVVVGDVVVRLSVTRQVEDLVHFGILGMRKLILCQRERRRFGVSCSNRM